MSAATERSLQFSTLSIRPGGEATFAANYNRQPFLFQHKLAGHPLLQIAPLREAAHALARKHPERLYYNLGKLEIDRGWDSTSERALTFAEAIEQIETADAWIILRGVQVLPDYGELLNRFLREVHEVSAKPLDGATMEHNISVIISSPRRITPYHMDADSNYLLQLSGSKTAFVFNGADRKVVTATELERFYWGDVNAAQYREASQSSAWRLEMTPGTGVHVPVTFPHWVQNGDHVSISASINFRFVDRTLPDMYRLNHYLRKAGLNPAAPGETALGDFAKRVAIRTMRTAMRLRRR